MEALFYRAERKNKYMKLNMENKKRIVVKVGTSTLTYPSGLMNLRKTERLVRCIADMQNSGRECLLVSSGAVSCGLAKIGLVGKPLSTEEKQAAAAVGQCELVDMYDRLFASYGHKIAQVLLTKDDLDSPVRSANASGTLKMLLGFGCIPVINENDTVSSEQLRIGSNDTLSAVVARLTDANLLINMTDIDGLYDKNPRVCPDARFIERVEVIDDVVRSYAGGAGSARGTGGMRAKLEAAESVMAAGIPMVIVNGADPEILYDITAGEFTGTYFGKTE